MERPYIFSTPTAWVFMAMLTKLAHRPKKKRAITNCQTEPANAKEINVKGYNNAAQIINCLLPKRAVSQPDNGRLTNWPTGSAKSTPPKAASLRCKASLISGMRLAQLANVMPATKKKTLTAMRWVRVLYKGIDTFLFLLFRLTKSYWRLPIKCTAKSQKLAMYLCRVHLFCWLIRAGWH